MECWNNGSPWRDLAGTCCSGCNILEEEPVQLRSCKTALGQGILGTKNGKDHFLSVLYPLLHFVQDKFIHHSTIPIVPDIRLLDGSRGETLP